MSLEGEEAVMGDLSEVQRQPVHVKKDDEGSDHDDGELGMKGISGEHQHNDGEDGKILDREEGQYDDYTNEEEEENDSPTNDETHNSDQSSSTGGAQLNQGKCYIF